MGKAQLDLGGSMPAVRLPSQRGGVVLAVLHRVVELAHGGDKPVSVYAESVRQRLDAARLDHGYLRDVVLVPEQMLGLLVEYLEGGALGLEEYLTVRTWRRCSS